MTDDNKLMVASQLRLVAKAQVLPHQTMDEVRTILERDGNVILEVNEEERTITIQDTTYELDSPAQATAFGFPATIPMEEQ